MKATTPLRAPTEAIRWIQTWHKQQGLSPALVREKTALLRSSLTVFYRATPGLFHLDLRSAFQKLAQLLPEACPHGLVSGDPHLGNYGSFRGPGGVAVFGLNDFDQLAEDTPLSHDLLRLAGSVVLAATERGFDERLVRHCLRAAVDGWVQTLREDARQPSYVTADEASRPVAHLLAHVTARTQHDFVSGHCEHIRGEACFRTHPQLAPLKGAARTRVIAALQRASRGFGRPCPVKRPLEVLDARWKLGSGGSSYGLARAYALVRARTSDKPARIIECKQLLPSLTRIPDARPTRADGKAVIAAQKALGGTPSLLSGHGIGKAHGYLIRELERFKAKLALETLDAEALEEVAREAGVLLARSHTQSAAQRKKLLAWAHGQHVALEESVYRFALAYRVQATADFRAFRRGR